MLKFGLNPGLSAVSTSLRRVRGADGDIQGSVGEDVCGPQVRARDETGNLHFSSVIALLCCCMQEGRDGVVSPRSLPKGAAGGVRCTRVQNARVAGGASDGFHRTGTTQAKTDRVSVLAGFQNRGRQALQDACEQPKSLHSRASAADPHGLQSQCTQ